MFHVYLKKCIILNYWAQNSICHLIKFVQIYFLWKWRCLVTQWGLTLHDPMACSVPGSSDNGVLQARIPEWVAIPFSRGSSQPRDGTWVSCIAGRFFTVWATKEARTGSRQWKILVGHGMYDPVLCSWSQQCRYLQGGWLFLVSKCVVTTWPNG